MEYCYNTTYFPTLAVDAPWERDIDLPFCPPFGGPAAELPFTEYPQPPFQEIPQSLLAHPNQQVGSSSAGHATNTGDRVRADAPEEGQKQVEPARRRSKDPAKRRRLTHKRATLLDELREVVGVDRRTPILVVLNTAIERLGGNASQGGPGRRERIKSAYDELHRLTNSQGRLRLVRCLERVIMVLNGEPALDPVIERVWFTET